MTDITVSFESYDEPAGPNAFGTLAKFSRAVPNFSWPGLEEHLYVAVELRSREPRYALDAFVSLPTRERPQWHTYETFATRDEAARAAVEFLAVAECCLADAVAMRPVRLPSEDRQRACARAVDADPRVQSLWAEHDAVYAVGIDEPGFDQRKRSDVRERLETTMRKAEEAFYAAHGWREFAGAT